MLENKKKSARDLNKPPTHGHLIIVFIYLQNKNRIAEVLNPHKMQASKIAIRPLSYIKKGARVSTFSSHQAGFNHGCLEA